MYLLLILYIAPTHCTKVHSYTYLPSRGKRGECETHALVLRNNLHQVNLYIVVFLHIYVCTLCTSKYVHGYKSTYKVREESVEF